MEKDLANEERIQAFLQELKNMIKQSQELGNKPIEENGYQVSFDKSTRKYKVVFSNTNILLAEDSEKGKYSNRPEKVYGEAIENYNELAETAERDGIATLDKPVGLVDSEELEEYLEKQKEKEGKEKADDKNKGEENEEEKDDEKPDLEDDEEEKDDEEEDKDKHKEKDRRLVYINKKVFKELMPSAKKYGDIAIDRDTNEVLGRNPKTGKMEPIESLQNVGQKRTNMSICGIEQGKHRDEQAIAMYQIGDSDAGFAIIRDGGETGNLDIKYIVKPRESKNIEDFKYVSLPMLENNEKIGQEQVKERTGLREGIERGGNIGEANEEMHEIDENNLLNEKLNNSMQQQTDPPPTTKEELKEILVKVLIEDEKMREITARRVADKIIEEDMTLEDAKEEVLEDGRMPSDDSNRRGMF